MLCCALAPPALYQFKRLKWRGATPDGRLFEITNRRGSLLVVGNQFQRGKRSLHPDRWQTGVAQ